MTVAAGRIESPEFRLFGRPMLQCTLRSVSLALFSLSGRYLVRRAERRLAMATATKKARAANQVVRGAGAASTSMAFVIFEDNAGSYHWRSSPATEESAQSEGFVSYEDAEQPARHVRDGAASASFNPAPGGTRRLISQRAAPRATHAMAPCARADHRSGSEMKRAGPAVV